ncbi:MAG: class I SAM-dependent methyltransferase [Rhodocyclales bacterium]|nr:class I SAM-dependent methyltransferase [Rhodocyclales bacterium]
MSFKDHFSAQSADYARYRPRYPDALFAWLANLAAARDTAWDCGTGSGQAALGLAPHFRRVIATDPSASQIAQATPCGNVEYRVATAEASGIEAGTADLLTIAQAIHWFDLERFYPEARRVLKPGGIIAVWTYTLLDIEPRIDALVSDYYHHVIGPYWPPERKMVDDGYRSLSFPFAPVAAPPFEIRMEWSLPDLLGYLGTWSATKAYEKAHGRDPCVALGKQLEPLWGDADRRKAVRWPLHLRVGRVS